MGIILKWLLNSSRKSVLDETGSGWSQMAGFWERDNEPTGIPQPSE
jgi:hypothetical protein